MSNRKRMLLLYNPKSGTQRFSPHLSAVVEKFSEAGFIVTVCPTQGPGDVGRIIAGYGSDYDYLVVSGGDGTISEGIDGLMPLAKRPVLGLIPSGTVNDFAVSLGIPRDILRAADIIVSGVPRPVDVGRFNEKHFSYVAAFGLFTDVSYSTPQNTKNLFGKLAYFIEGVKRLGSVESYSCEFILDGEAVYGDFMLGFIGNAHLIAGYRLPEEMYAQMDDGLFDVMLVRTPNTLKEKQDIISTVLTQEINTDLIISRKAREVIFSATAPIAWTLDGDFGGEFYSAKVVNMHQAMDIVTPTN